VKLRVEKSQHESGTRIYSLQGDLHGGKDGYAFQNEVRGCYASGSCRVVIDLEQVARIDSCGIGILAAIAMSAQNSGGGLVLASLPERIERILGVTHFLTLVDHAGSVEEALEKLDAMGLGS
jgi:anti-anti-sigma factor